MKMLYILNVANKINSFCLSSILAAKELGIEYHIAGNWGYQNELERLADETKYGIRIHQIDFIRSPFDCRNYKAYKQLKKLVQEEKFDVMHCNTPIGGLLGRIVGIQCKISKIIYQTHGFHFYKGAPLKNWLLYYPVEKLFAHFTDVLVTINREDYALAQKKLKAKKVVYVPGVGVDLEKFGKSTIHKAEKRKELDVPENSVVLLSVGEVNENKNQQVIIRAMAEISDENIHYLIAGKGNQIDNLQNLADSLNLGNRVHFLGFRKDIPELCMASDIFCFPSKREGLGLASLEAMACGLPILTSNVHGINDYSEDGVTGYKFSPVDTKGFAEGIKKLSAEPETCQKMRGHNQNAVKKYSIQHVLPLMNDLYNI